MNEPTRQSMLDLAEIVITENPTSERWVFNEVELATFTEAIIRKCAGWMEDGNIPDGFYEAGRMLKHFGIEQ